MINTWFGKTTKKWSKIFNFSLELRQIISDSYLSRKNKCFKLDLLGSALLSFHFLCYAHWFFT